MLLKVIAIVLATLLLPRILEGPTQSQAILSAQPQPEVTFAPVVKGMVLPDVEL